MTEKRLHIGSGKVYLPGWTNVDLFSNAKADLYCDMLRLPFDPESFDLVYSSHVLEHTHRHTVLAVLHQWRSLLKPGGILRLAVPDFDAVARYYLCHPDKLHLLQGLLYGGQDAPLNEHHIAFNRHTLTTYLHQVGFEIIRDWDWRTTCHSEFDDFSQAYLPKMDKTDGTLMSLNLEAIR